MPNAEKCPQTPICATGYLRQSMAACPACDASLPGRARACPDCGTLADFSVDTATGTEGQATRAANQARKDVGLLRATGVEPLIAERLLDKADAEARQSRFPQALVFAQAARRAATVAKTRTRLQGELARAEEAIRLAKEGGADTAAAEKALEEAAAALKENRLRIVPTWLKRASVRAVEETKVHSAESVLAGAERAIRYAKERGADVAAAEQEFATAQDAIRAKAFDAAREAAGRARTAAERARKLSRYEKFVRGADHAIDLARKSGSDLTEARRLVSEARVALSEDRFADAQAKSASSREAVAEAKRFRAGEVLLGRVEKLARKEERRGTDVGGPGIILIEALAALDGHEYRRLRELARDAREAIADAVVARRLRITLDGLAEDVAELRTIGAFATEAEGLLTQAREALEALNFDQCRRLAAQARRAADDSREARRQEIVINTIQRIVAAASAGGHVDAGSVSDLIRDVEAMLAGGEAVDVDALVSARLTVVDAQKLKDATMRLGEVQTMLVELKRADIDVSGADEAIALVGEALDEGRIEEAERQITELGEVARTLIATLRDSANETVQKALSAADKAREAGIPIPDAIRLVHSAQAAMEAGKVYEALEFGRIAQARAESAVKRHFEEEAKRDVEQMKAVADRVKRARERIDILAERIEYLTGIGVDVNPARESLESAQQRLEEKRVEEVEAHLSATERIVEGMRAALRKSAEDALDRTRRQVAEARAHGLMTPEMEAVSARAEQAVREDHHREAIDAMKALEETIEHAREERVAEQRRKEMERARKASDRFVRVRRMIEELKKANIDIQGSDEALLEAEKALQVRDFEAVEELLADLEVTAREMRAELVAATRFLVGKAREAVDGAERAGVDVADARGLLESSEDLLAKGRLDDAVESANAAKQRVDALMRVLSEEVTRKENLRVETARHKIDRLKLVIEDLRRADITIEGSEGALTKAEEALAAKEYEDVHTILAETEAMADSLRRELKAAAEQLLARSRENVEEAKVKGLQVRRADMVLLNASDAIEDQRYVEAIEYHKVIDDIVDDAKRMQRFRELEVEVGMLRSDLAQAAELGGDTTGTEALLDRAQEEVSLGRFDRVAEFTERIRQQLTITRQHILAGRLDRARIAIGQAQLLGASVPEAEAMIGAAEQAIERESYDAVDAIAKQIEAKAAEASQAFLETKAQEDFLALEDLAKRVRASGLEVPEVSRFLEEARRLKVEGNFESMAQVVAEARRLLESTSHDHIATEHRRKIQGLSAMLEAARRIGASTSEVEQLLDQAEKAIQGNDLALADILVKQAEVSTGLHIQQFIQNKYPNLVVRMPTKGLQANAWNRFVVEIENRGTMGAKNVNLNIEGDVEVRGAEPISELGVDEKKSIEVGVRPLHGGDVPVNARVFYNRYFDDNKYEIADARELKVETAGTYLVEDVFLIHVDGRLVAHESRRFRQEIDEDIFSGMLTVVQDFIRDSFRQRTHTRLKRLDFGQSKILIERSTHCFLTTVVLGSEPALLPLYMAEVLREIEGEFGTTLGAWSGMLHELPGINDVIRKLLLATEARTAERGLLGGSEVAQMERLLVDAEDSGAEIKEVQELLAKAESSLETDMDLAWQLLSKAKAQARETQVKLLGRMKLLVDQTADSVDRLRGLGVDAGPAEILLKEAREAFESGRFDKVEEIANNVRGTLERVQADSMAKEVEMELGTLIQDIEKARGEGVDTNHAEAFLVRIEDALQRKDFPAIDEFLRRARESLREQRRKTILKRSQQELERLGAMLVEGKALGAVSPEAEGLLLRAREALAEGRTDDLDAIVRQASAIAKATIQKFLEDKYPRLFLTMPTAGLQAEAWNRFVVELANKGNLAAKDVEFRVTGDVDVRGLEMVPRIEPNEKKRVEFGVRPRSSGPVPLDMEVRYHRPLDEREYELTDSKQLNAEPPGTYVVEDAFLIHRDGRLIAHESRTFRDPVDEDIFSGMLTAVLSYVKESFHRAEEGLRRVDFGNESKILFERSPNTYLATAITGEEPVVLPLYMVDALREVEGRFGDRLDQWNGFLSELAGVEDIVRRLLFVTETPNADLGPLARSPLAETMHLVADTEPGEGRSFIEEAREVIESRDFAEASEFIEKAVASYTAGREQLHEQLREAVITQGAMSGLQLSDEQMKKYIDVVHFVVEAIFAAREKAGLDRVWPVKRVAVRMDTQEALDAVTSFRKIIVNQSGAKELDIVPPGQTWQGLSLALNLDSEAIARAYRLWARKIEILLRSQDAWKIKQGIDRGEYNVGVEGQKVRIDPSMVWFTETVPDHVVEQTFDGGRVYVDTTMTEALLAEGYARELVNIIQDVRRELRLTTDIWIETRIRASETLSRLLKNWKDFISKETNTQALRFVRGDLTEGYVVECNLGAESFSVSVKPIEDLVVQP